MNERQLLLRDAWDRALTFDVFLDVAIHNRQLWHDLARRATLPAELAPRVRALQSRYRFLVLLEDWCGDAVNTVPYMVALAAGLPGSELRVLHRDRNPEIMDLYLSPRGARAIPVCVTLDQQFRDPCWWGSRPTELQGWVMSPAGQALAKDERYKRIRAWYARDRGRSTLGEIVSDLERIERKAQVA